MLSIFKSILIFFWAKILKKPIFFLILCLCGLGCGSVRVDKNPCESACLRVRVRLGPIPSDVTKKVYRPTDHRHDPPCAPSCANCRGWERQTLGGGTGGTPPGLLSWKSFAERARTKPTATGPNSEASPRQGILPRPGSSARPPGRGGERRRRAGGARGPRH